MRCVQMFAVRGKLQIYFRHFIANTTRQWPICKCSAIGRQAGSLIKILHLFSAMYVLRKYQSTNEQ